MQLREIAQEFVEYKDGVEEWKFSGRKYSAAAVWNAIRPKEIQAVLEANTILFIYL